MAPDNTGKATVAQGVTRLKAIDRRYCPTYVHFAVGQVIRRAHGGDSDYFGSWLTARF